MTTWGGINMGDIIKIGGAKKEAGGRTQTILGGAPVPTGGECADLWRSAPPTLLWPNHTFMPIFIP